ncbi:hypothetical protein [Microcystis aeruginosa]|uniref:hypothetical protein n=1 Tax=Microcystis aeruginosa TaxID=1126 RepID=UPI00232E3D92|nr:hypothetical protein [Microcystis aeruginosa]MDB9435228.1 hypothetical protein [Microcystis aeruginosa CS-552/01]
MNLRSVKTIVLSGIALLVATLPSLAQIPIEPIRLTTATRFNCGPHLETYIVRSLDNRRGTGIRCVKFSKGQQGSSIPRLSWYGEGTWEGATYRHLGQAIDRGRMLVGFASDIHGNGEDANFNYPGNLDIRTVRPGVIRVTGAWNEEWRSVSSVNYNPLPRPKTCGSHFNQYQVTDLTGGRRGKGLRCMLKEGPANTTWFGNGDWDGNTYSHLGTIGKNGYGAGDICPPERVHATIFGTICNNFDYGSLTFTPTRSGFNVNGAWSEKWLLVR